MKKRVKVGKYKTVFRGTIFSIQQAKVIFPSGTVKTFERAVRSPSVCILAIDDKGRLLLTREYRTKFKKYLWRLPGGRMEKERSPVQAAQRELREETGYKAKKMELFHMSDRADTLDWKLYAYLATDLVRAPLFSGEEDEDINIVWISIDKAFQLVKTGKIENEMIAYLVFKLYYKLKGK